MQRFQYGHVVVILLIAFSPLCADWFDDLDWGNWITIREGLYVRAACDEYNDYAKKYVWHAQVKNETNREVSVSIALSTSPETPPDDWNVWKRSTIQPNSSGRYCLYFLTTNQHNQVWTYWKHIQFKDDDDDDEFFNW